MHLWCSFQDPNIFSPLLLLFLSEGQQELQGDSIRAGLLYKIVMFPFSIAIVQNLFKTALKLFKTCLKLPSDCSKLVQNSVQGRRIVQSCSKNV